MVGSVLREKAHSLCRVILDSNMDNNTHNSQSTSLEWCVVYSGQRSVCSMKSTAFTEMDIINSLSAL